MRIIFPVASVWRSTEVLYARDLGRALADRGWGVTVYTRDANEVDTLFRESSLSLRHLRMGGLADISSTWNFSRNLALEPQGTVVLAQTFAGAFMALAARRLAKRSDIKVYLTLHRSVEPHTTLLARKVYRSLDGIIFSSAYARRLFKKPWQTMPVDKKKLHVVRNSLAFPPPPRTEEPKGPVIGMFMGDIAPMKGLETLIDALPVLRGNRVRLRMAGRGNPDYIDSLRRRAINSGVMDLISWKTSRSDSFMELIGKAHFGVFPYGSAHAFGYHNLEFMAAGLPQIVTATHVAAEYIGVRGGALLVPADDVAALGESMLAMGQNAALRGEYGRQALHRFNDALPFDRFLALTEAILTDAE